MDADEPHRQRPSLPSPRRSSAGDRRRRHGTAPGGGNNLGGLARYTDVINVPAGTTTVIRIRFFDFLGTFVYHCHRVDHEDNGMMSLVQVLPQHSIRATGAGAGGAPQVNVFDGGTNTILNQFNAFDPGFRGGVNVAVGDVNNDGISDVICAAGPGGGPEVKVYSGKDFSSTTFRFQPSFTGGANIAAGDINGDGFDDLRAWRRRRPQVTVFNGKQATCSTPSSPSIHASPAEDVAPQDLVGNGRIYCHRAMPAADRKFAFDDQARSVRILRLDQASPAALTATGAAASAASIIQPALRRADCDHLQCPSIHESSVDPMHRQRGSDLLLISSRHSTKLHRRVRVFNQTTGTNFWPARSRARRSPPSTASRSTCLTTSSLTIRALWAGFQ